VQNSPNTQHHRLNVLYANITNYTKNSVSSVTVLYFLNKTMKNFSSQPQNIYAQLSGNFLSIF